MPGVAAYVIDYNSSSNQPWQAEIRCWSSADTALHNITASVRFYEGTVPASGHIGGHSGGQLPA
jgi:hypothetical protein